MRGAPETVAAVLGAALTVHTGTPIAGAAAQKILLPALKAILEDQAEEKNRLSKADIDTLVNGPYETGMEYLNQAAQKDRTPEKREKYIEKAFEEFMRAYGQQKTHGFRRALVEYQLGNSCALLAEKEDARQWFQRSYTSAVDYLRKRRDAVRFKRRMKKEFLEEAPSVLELIEDLVHLQRKTGGKLDLQFVELVSVLPRNSAFFIEGWLLTPSYESFLVEKLEHFERDSPDAPLLEEIKDECRKYDLLDDAVSEPEDPVMESYYPQMESYYPQLRKNDLVEISVLGTPSLEHFLTHGEKINLPQKILNEPMPLT